MHCCQDCFLRTQGQSGVIGNEYCTVSQFTVPFLWLNDKKPKQTHIRWHYALLGSTFYTKNWKTYLVFKFCTKIYFLNYEVTRNLSRVRKFVSNYWDWVIPDIWKQITQPCTSFPGTQATTIKSDTGVRKPWSCQNLSQHGKARRDNYSLSIQIQVQQFGAFPPLRQIRGTEQEAANTTTTVCDW